MPSKSVVRLAVVMVSVVAWAGPASAGSTGSESIVAQWADADGNAVLLREGTYRDGKGFGWTKIQRKHKIRKIESVRFVTSNPAGGAPQGDSRVYVAYANRKECNKSYCRYTDSLPVRAVVNFSYRSTYHDANVDGVVGVVTTYCLNPDQAHACPDWVDSALGNPTSKYAGQHLEPGVDLSYSPAMLVDGT